jgi:hypothetical protein
MFPGASHAMTLHIRRSLLPSLVLAFAALAVQPTRAQAVSIYVESNNTRFNNVPTGIIFTPATGAIDTQYTNFWASGVGGGLTLSFIPLGPVRVGLDFRGSTRPGTLGADTGMMGLRIGVKVPVIRIKPYVEAAGGYIATRTNNVGTVTTTGATQVSGTFTNQYAGWEILGGIDYPIVHFVDFRVIEIGGGTAYTIGGNNLSNLNLQTISLFSVNTGIVVHF